MLFRSDKADVEAGLSAVYGQLDNRTGSYTVAEMCIRDSIENIDFVNFFGRDDAHRPCQSLFFNHFTQGIALLFRQLLGEMGIRDRYRL